MLRLIIIFFGRGQRKVGRVAPYPLLAMSLLDVYSFNSERQAFGSCEYQLFKSLLYNRVVECATLW